MGVFPLAIWCQCPLLICLHPNLPTSRRVYCNTCFLLQENQSQGDSSQGDSNQSDSSQGDSNQSDSNNDNSNQGDSSSQSTRGDNEEDSNVLSVEETNVLIGLLETVVILWCSVLPQLEKVCCVCSYYSSLWSETCLELVKFVAECFSLFLTSWKTLWML